MTDQLIFLKPGQYMSSSDNRFVTFKNKEPCLILEKRESLEYGKWKARYIVLVNNEQLITADNNFVTE